MQSNQQSGFTLLEVVLAIGITAMIGVAATQLLGNVTDARNATDERANLLKELQRADMWLKRDFWQLTGRKVRDQYGDHTPIITTHNDYDLEFTRSGVRAMAIQQEEGAEPIRKSNLQRVAYALRTHDSDYCEKAKKRIENKQQEADGNCLIRFVWPVLDLVSESEPLVQILIDDIESVKFYFKGLAVNPNDLENKLVFENWEEEWPPATVTPDMVDDLIQLKIEYEVPVMGLIERWYEVPRYAMH